MLGVSSKTQKFEMTRWQKAGIIRDSLIHMSYRRC